VKVDLVATGRAAYQR